MDLGLSQTLGQVQAGTLKGALLLRDLGVLPSQGQTKSMLKKQLLL